MKMVKIENPELKYIITPENETNKEIITKVLELLFKEEKIIAK